MYQQIEILKEATSNVFRDLEARSKVNKKHFKNKMTGL